MFSKLRQKGSLENSPRRKNPQNLVLYPTENFSWQGLARKAADDIEPAAQRISEQLESASHEVAVKAKPMAERVADAISDTAKQASKDIPKAAEHVSEDAENAAKVCNTCMHKFGSLDCYLGAHLFVQAVKVGCFIDGRKGRVHGNVSLSFNMQVVAKETKRIFKMLLQRWLKLAISSL